LLSVAGKNENIYRTRRVLKSMADNDLPFAISTDFPVYPIELLPIDAGLAIKEGLSLWQAERAITLQAAELLYLADRVGSIEPGKDADLVLWNEHPLLSLQAAPQQVFINGKLLFAGQTDPRQHLHYIKAWESLGE
jgi:imidazolonepropionase-like amidohydrolase